MTCNNQMIKYSHLNQTKRITQEVRDLMILAAGEGFTGRMVMREYAGGSIAMQCRPYDFTGMYLGPRQGAPK